MDGTFKTVPTVFHQLYTIHALVGGAKNFIFPMVYVLMTSRSEESYVRLFEELGRVRRLENASKIRSFPIVKSFTKKGLLFKAK
jgi:hypothetical protein